MWAPPLGVDDPPLGVDDEPQRDQGCAPCCARTLGERLFGVVTAVPICGGFCADTTSPEWTSLRHVSNELTPPQPCLKRRARRRDTTGGPTRGGRPRAVGVDASEQDE